VLRAAEVKRDPTLSRADLTTVRSRAARELVVDPQLVEDALADGYRAGYDAGFQSGLADAAAAGAEQQRQRAAQLQTIVTQLNGASEALRHREGTAMLEIEDQVALAALRIAEVLVGHELACTRDLGADAIARALQFAPNDGMVTARLNPDDADALGDPDLVAPGRALNIVRDASLQPGDTIVEVAGCRIDARIDAALERVRALLEEGTRS
jgi:flagellar biosynthesis/type III secretory pathway protein FliH